ncbi:hypothetical protein DFQ28_004502 [Apophysomyces sp. BC1034]|nr:hypothetical protein DFQ30_007539 [Apophysomyces sp. BC1015]KAG0188687.1 hypothetical protein DFQ28_004502 [Apophysomyces sp. BC1034]
MEKDVVAPVYGDTYTKYGEDDETTMTGATDPDASYVNSPLMNYATFEQEIHTDNADTAQAAYFLDGGNRFISLPTLGSSKSASHILRLFEQWLENKLLCHQRPDHLPILEDGVELLAEDILNQLKLRTSLRSLTGISKVFLKIRTGHIYFYHHLEDGQPLITEDLEEVFQQFPLFVEVMIYTMTDTTDDSTIQFLLTIENTTINPGDPYHLMQQISHA